MNQIPRRVQNRIATERNILAAALQVFARSGYSGTSMDGIAAEAGLTKPTLYEYFDSKEHLFTACLLYTSRCVYETGLITLNSWRITWVFWHFMK